ncbi:MAG: hypothetical protein OEW35_11065 [Gammaproteobacteria bacterium]|nr:hypothetical protein [Gammaproteobacteria bacterium]MDH4253902.1 hypothetical protein [Gammaproteobacteria bacterium]MDH5309785.1 hypothetical protein [Gammaproteobacteria bacterium]
MFMETPQNLLLITFGAFLLGWFVGKIGAYFGNKFQAKARDPRDDRIRSLDAELRIAKAEVEKAKTEIEDRDKKIEQADKEIEGLEKTIGMQSREVEKLRRDLKDSVKKTRELRAELSDRAEENLRSEVKLREVETELSVAQASTDLIATGVLDFSVTPDGADDEDEPRITKSIPR